MNNKLQNLWNWSWPNRGTIVEFAAKTEGNYGKQRTIDVLAKIQPEHL